MKKIKSDFKQFIDGMEIKFQNLSMYTTERSRKNLEINIFVKGRGLQKVKI